MGRMRKFVSFIALFWWCIYYFCASVLRQRSPNWFAATIKGIIWYFMSLGLPVSRLPGWIINSTFHQFSSADHSRGIFIRRTKHLFLYSEYIMSVRVAQRSHCDGGAVSNLKYSTLIGASRGGPNLSRPHLKSVTLGIKPVLFEYFLKDTLARQKTRKLLTAASCWVIMAFLGRLKGGVCYGDCDNKPPAEALGGSYSRSRTLRLWQPLGLGPLPWKLGLGRPSFPWWWVNEVLSPVISSKPELGVGETTLLFVSQVENGKCEWNHSVLTGPLWSMSTDYQCGAPRHRCVHTQTRVQATREPARAGFVFLSYQLTCGLEPKKEINTLSSVTFVKTTRA